MNVVLDTCAVLWLTLDPSSLSPRAHQAIADAERVVLSSISAWEIGVKWRSGKIDLGTSYEDYISRLINCADFEILPVDTKLWSMSVTLKWDHRDPADRVIVSMAQDLDLPIITADEEMQRFFKRCIA